MVAMEEAAVVKVRSCVRGYHAYKDVWEAFIGEELTCQQEGGNSSDINFMLYFVCVFVFLTSYSDTHNLCVPVNATSYSDTHILMCTS